MNRVVQTTLCVCLLTFGFVLSAVETPAPAAAQQFVRTELFFGTTRDGKQIDAKDWKSFLDTYITPAFPDGLTVVDAQGQWKNAKGVLITEPSKVVVLVYSPSKEKSAAVANIVEKYKALHGQESVLEATAPVAADFHLENAKPAAQSVSPLDDYAKFAASPRENFPEGYIGYLKKMRFTKGELDNLPKCAVILFSSDVKGILKVLGETDVTELELGSATSNRLFIVRRNNAPAYAINLGLPGGGGIQTQVAELGALGFKHVVHVGTCAALSDALADASLVLSNGSYRDGAAVMLANNQQSISSPDNAFSASIKAMIESSKTPCTEALGYTVPIYYYQPNGLIKSLIAGRDYGAGRALYMEMEQAAFFETAKHAKVSAASLVVVSDRYAMVDGALKHTFAENVNATLIKALETCRSVFEKLNRGQ